MNISILRTIRMKHDRNHKEKYYNHYWHLPKALEIAKSLGRVDKAGHGWYNVVIGDLKTLQSWRFIHQHKDKKQRVLGPIPTVYYIVYESVILKILSKFPSLVFYLQRKDEILNMVLKKKIFF
jgi:hypothetical protein